MTRGRKVLLGLLAVLVVTIVGVGWYLGPIAPIATGYAAKIVCSGHLVSDRDTDDVLGDLPDNPLVPFLRVTADEEDQVRASLLGLWPSTASATDGLGCTLADDRPAYVALPEQHAPEPEVAWPEGQGVAGVPDGADADALVAAIDTAFVEDDDQGRRRNTRAVVVVKDGDLVTERYGDGFDRDTALLGWSMGKSVASAMVGRAVEADQLSVDDRDLRDEWAGDARADITVEHLLTMTDGLAFEEVYDPDTDATRMLFAPGDAAAYAADQDLVADPGTRWAYSSGTTNILCDAVQEATGRGPEAARELVFDPLGMTSAVMEPDASGGLVCSSFLYATAQDWARFGQWYLQDGRWDGDQLLPDGWVDASFTAVEVPSERPYGYQWWLNDAGDGQLRMPTVPADAAWASGNEGQQVVVIPSEELVVVRLGFSGAFDGVDWGLEPMLDGVIDALS